MKTRKQKIQLSVKEKQALWDNIDANTKSSKLSECVMCENEESSDFCKVCKFMLAFTDEGFLACTNAKCGILYKNVPDSTAEWRYYGAGDTSQADPSRCGLPINQFLEESSYGCQSVCHGKSTYEMRKISKYVNWQSMPTKERTLYNVFQYITALSYAAGLPKIIVDDAISYHHKISTGVQTSFRCDNRDGLIAASVYIACRANNYARTAREIAAIFHLNQSCATHGCKNAQTIINDIEKNINDNNKTVLHKTTSTTFIDRYCSKLPLIPDRLVKLIKYISIKIEQGALMPEHTPHATATGIIYLIVNLCNLQISKSDIKQISDTSEVTVNKCYNKILTFAETVIPPVIIKEYNIQLPHT